MNPRLLRPRQAGGFNPRTISGLFGWWDFSDVSTLGPTNSGTGTVSNNGPVKYVADKSGNGRHMTNAGADSVSPTYLEAAQNSRSVLGFDGGDDLQALSSLTFTAQTVFMVLRMASGAASNSRAFSQAIVSTEDFSGSGHHIPIQRNSNLNSIGSYSNGGNRAVVSVSTGTWVLFMCQHTGSEIQNRLNNGTAQTYAHTLNTTFASYRIGGGARSNTALGGLAPWQDRIAETLVYSTSLSESERNAVARWLGTKWGITVS